MNRVLQFKNMVTPEDFFFINFIVLKIFDQNLDEFLAGCETPKDAISKALDWEKSSLGVEYWSMVHISLMCNFKQWND